MTAAAAGEQPRPRTLAWLVAALLAVVAVAAIDYWRDGEAVEVPLDPADLRPGFGSRTFADALAQAEGAVAGARQRVARNPGQWLHLEVLARALMARHRLTASPADLAEAGRLLDEALRGAPWPAGPSLTAAAVALAGHDFATAEAALERFDAAVVPPGEAEQLEARSIRCEIAFQRGRLAEAERLCAGSDDLALQRRLANIKAKRGDTAEAAQMVEALLRRPGLPPAALAQLALQRASVALAEGDWQASGRWARAADRVFPGYWLSEAWVAQQFVLEGDRPEAVRRFAALAERTGDPDVLDALARLARAAGRTADAVRWASEAGSAWEARARLLPHGYEVHHAEHLLLNGEPQAALALAGAAYARRPHPGTMAHFGYALWREGQHARALEVVRDGEARGFLTADLKLVETLALGSLGRASEAGAAMAQARRLNPHIDSARQQYVVFGRD